MISGNAPLRIGYSGSHRNDHLLCPMKLVTIGTQTPTTCAIRST
jgi:hypothetical protein